MRPAIRVAIATCALLVMALPPSGCGHSSKRQPPAAKEMTVPYLELERTGGFVGWNQRLRLASDGAWVVESRVDARELGAGTFDDSTMKQLRLAIDAVPKSAHGSFTAKGADFIDFRLLLIDGINKNEVVSGPWLNGRSGIPADWAPVLTILGTPFDSLPSGR